MKQITSLLRTYEPFGLFLIQNNVINIVIIQRAAFVNSHVSW